jgi:hypothetical protein
MITELNINIRTKMGASASRTDLQPNSDEISKAVVLSSLANLDNLERRNVANRYDNVGLENILMAPDFILCECRQNNNNTLLRSGGGFLFEICLLSK